MPCSSAGSDSSSRHQSLVGRPPNDATEYALSWAMWMHSSGARSIRAIASRCPPPSVTAMHTSTASSSASLIAAAIARWAAASVADGAIT